MPWQHQPVKQAEHDCTWLRAMAAGQSLMHTNDPVHADILLVGVPVAVQFATALEGASLRPTA